jgi:hypothetical protein
MFPLTSGVSHGIGAAFVARRQNRALTWPTLMAAKRPTIQADVAYGLFFGQSEGVVTSFSDLSGIKSVGIKQIIAPSLGID